MLFGDNINGYPKEIVCVLFGVNEVQFGHFISILSVLRNHKPEKVMIHCDCNQLIGEYYERVLKISQKTKTQVIVRNIVKPLEIFGQQLSEESLNWHSADIMRIKVLQEFGGIYLDRDTYVVKSLDTFRKYEMTLEWYKERDVLAIHVLIARRNARYLKLWLESYRLYDSKQWFFNAGFLPKGCILDKRPELIHRINSEFGGYGPHVCPKIYQMYYKNWIEDYYAIHLVIRNKDISIKEWCFGDNVKTYPSVMSFDEKIIRDLNSTFGEMARMVFDFERDLINK